MIFKKQPKVTWFTTEDFLGLQDTVKPERSSKFIPQWLKDTPSFPGEGPINMGTIKDCPSTFDFMSKGYIVPMWCDLHLDIKEDGSVSWNTPYNRFIIQHHKDEQYKDYVPKQENDNIVCVLKLVNPFLCKTTSGYGMIQMPLYYHFNKDYEVMPGVVWTDIHHELNLQMIIRKPGKYFIERGTPLVQYIPYKREKIKTEYTDTLEQPNLLRKYIGDLLNIHSKFKRSYKIKQSKCPFNK